MKTESKNSEGNGLGISWCTVTWYKFGANKEYTSRWEIRGDEPR